MSDRGESLRILAVRFERTLPGPVERVWEHLTECPKLAGWFGDDGIIEAREGGRVRLLAGHIRGVVTQCRPLRRLTYTWNVFDPGAAESAYPESYVTFDLESATASVGLKLLHLPILERFERQNMMGWHTFLDMLEAAVAGRTVEPRAVYMQRNAQRYGVDLGNPTR
jgi:uncharacterized protein YndB with AHSA1/START domain